MGKCYPLLSVNGVATSRTTAAIMVKSRRDLNPDDRRLGSRYLYLRGFVEPENEYSFSVLHREVLHDCIRNSLLCALYIKRRSKR